MIGAGSSNRLPGLANFSLSITAPDWADHTMYHVSDMGIHYRISFGINKLEDFKQNMGLERKKKKWDCFMLLS